MENVHESPEPAQYLGYSFGRKLPDDMRDWVRTDVAVREPSVGIWSAL